jgi:hypothetical protein
MPVLHGSVFVLHLMHCWHSDISSENHPSRIFYLMKPAPRLGQSSIVKFPNIINYRLPVPTDNLIGIAQHH